jgi:hypothetical protein
MLTCCSYFQLSLSLCMPSFPKTPCFSALAYLQQSPNTDMWLIPSHLAFVCFLDLLGDHLECFLELYYLCLRLRSILLECVHYLDYYFVTDQFHALCLGLCYMCLRFFCLCQDFCYPLLQGFYLSLSLMFLCLCSGELCLQLLHVLHPFDVFCDCHCLLPLI